MPVLTHMTNVQIRYLYNFVQQRKIVLREQMHQYILARQSENVQNIAQRTHKKVCSSISKD
jgi:hypothetical protein